MGSVDADSMFARTPTLTWAGDRFLRVSFGDQPGAAVLARVHRATAQVRVAGIEGVVDVTPAYTTLLIAFDLLRLPTDAEAAVLAALGSDAADTVFVPERTVEVPVCYAAEFSPDLEELARLHGLTTAEVVARHAAAEYRVAFIGFTPGFAYLSGLPESLATARLASPRPRVPAGAVGIAGTQTGIYPGGTPGGWRLVGRTPLRTFDVSREPAALLAPGDRLRFRPIDTAEFHFLAAAQHNEGR